jgi:hypothetical protein
MDEATTGHAVGGYDDYGLCPPVSCGRTAAA